MEGICYEKEKKMKIIKRKNKFYDCSKFGQPQIRLWHRKGNKKKRPCYHLKCGDCDKILDIYYGGGGLEINGVIGSIKDWREILLPLLDPKNNNEEDT